MKNIEQFKTKISEIDESIKEMGKISNREYKPIIDGIIDFNAYSDPNLRYKILWVLNKVKVPDNSDNQCLRNSLTKIKTETGIKKGWRRPFSNIVYITYGILNNKTLDNISKIDDNPDISDVLKSVSLICVNKCLVDEPLPDYEGICKTLNETKELLIKLMKVKPEVVNLYKNAGLINIPYIPKKTKSRQAELLKIYNENKALLLKQIEVYDPDIILFCNNLFLFADDLGLNKLHVKETCQYLKKNDKLYINTCHPSYINGKLIKMKLYFNEIFETINENFPQKI